MFLQGTTENWSLQVRSFVYVHNTHFLSHLHFSPYEIVFYTQPRILLKFQSNFSPNSNRKCTAQYCSELLPYSPFQSTD